MKVREQVDSAIWRCRPRDTFVVRPWSTFKDIVNSTFWPVQDAWRVAHRCRFDEMYHPPLGEFRRRKTYTSLAPSYAMPYRDRAILPLGLSSYQSYQPKRGEWETEMKKSKKFLRRSRSLLSFEPLIELEEETSEKKPRNVYTVPVTTSRAQNYFLYWTGRFNGVTSCGPLFYPTNFEGSEDRRYHRIFWGPNLVDYVTPTARHAASLLLSAY
ncbi:unnamed protein product [Enterobius vermicularis]|uniref:Uncharacterized protein n=1 Tax=Enterobius vermicularis TaxID=51028 RepID=A0A3P6IG41_ENTVE|nr:unnamed protein product [Enterobius vermicularis]